MLILIIAINFYILKKERKNINENILIATDNKKKAARFDDSLESSDSDDELPDDVSSSENDSSSEDEDAHESDSENNGFGIGTNLDMTNVNFDSSSAINLDKVSSESEILLLVGEVMLKIRSLVKTIKNSTNILRFVRMKQQLLGIAYSLIQDFKIRYVLFILTH